MIEPYNLACPCRTIVYDCSLKTSKVNWRSTRSNKAKKGVSRVDEPVKRGLHNYLCSVLFRPQREPAFQFVRRILQHIIITLQVFIILSLLEKGRRRLLRSNMRPH